MRRPAAAMPAVVLGIRPLGEADLLVVLLTPEHGKVRAAARNARRSKRRFAGGLTGGAVGQAQLVRRPGSLWRLDGFTALADHGAIGRDLTRFAYVAYLCELTDVLLVEPEADPRLFAALTVALAQTVGQPPDPGVLRWYELALLSALGLLPALSDCAVCGDPVLSEAALSRDSVRFDPRRGGVLCTVHGAGLAPRPGPGNDGGSALLRSARVVAAAAELHVAAEPPRWTDAGVTGAPAPPSTTPSTVVRRGLRDLLRDVLRLHLRRPLRALEFFAHLPTIPRSEGERVDPDDE